MMSRDAIDFLLRQRGLKKISDKTYSAKGAEHNFDNVFIKAFDLFLSGVSRDSMTKSQFNNIILFIDFADGKISQLHEEYNTLVECDKYLATIEEITNEYELHRNNKCN